MIYSRWRPEKGGYDYFETSERYGLADDLPVPKLPGGTAIGVSSLLSGRMPRGSARHVGQGPYAKGLVMPITRAGLSGLTLAESKPYLVTGVLAAVAFVIGYFRGKRTR